MLETAYLISPLTTYPPLNIHEKSEVWDCTTCSTCSYRCPREVKPMDVLIGLRAFLLEQGRVPHTLVDVLEAVFKYGNPWGLSRDKRSYWTQNLKVKYVSEGEPNDLLYYVGCAASYDSRAQKVARSTVKNLNALGIDFSILGNKETCCGNEIYSLGEKGLFEELRKYNLNLFHQYGVKEIITTSPHCYNAFMNRYGGGLQVKHYTQYFADLLDSQKLKFSRNIKKVVTYQDSCFLGKYNGIYDEPRKIIESIPGVSFIEMSMSRKRSVCCEGGGGRMWHDVPGERLAEKRVKDALDLGAEIIAVACPFCLLTFDDAIKTTGNEEKIQVKDIMELVAEAL
jgi:Fe-S oxidoreductase